MLRWMFEKLDAFFHTEDSFSPAQQSPRPSPPSSKLVDCEIPHSDHLGQFNGFDLYLQYKDPPNFVRVQRSDGCVVKVFEPVDSVTEYSHIAVRESLKRAVQRGLISPGYVERTAAAIGYDPLDSGD